MNDEMDPDTIQRLYGGKNGVLSELELEILMRGSHVPGGAVVQTLDTQRSQDRLCSGCCELWRRKMLFCGQIRRAQALDKTETSIRSLATSF